MFRPCHFRPLGSVFAFLQFPLQRHARLVIVCQHSNCRHNDVISAARWGRFETRTSSGIPSHPYSSPIVRLLSVTALGMESGETPFYLTGTCGSFLARVLYASCVLVMHCIAHLSSPCAAFTAFYWPAVEMAGSNPSTLLKPNRSWYQIFFSNQCLTIIFEISASGSINATYGHLWYGF